MAEVDAVNEHRTAPRRRLLKSGKISFGGGAIDCTVRNFSETGAALDVTSPVGIPDHFTLVIGSDHFLTVAGRLAEAAPDRRPLRRQLATTRSMRAQKSRRCARSATALTQFLTGMPPPRLIGS